MYLSCAQCRTRVSAMPLGMVRVGRRSFRGIRLGQEQNFLPAGTQLSYTATWGNDFLSWNDPNAIQSKVQSALSAQWGVIVDSQFHTSSDIINFSGESGFTLRVHTDRDYGQAGDIKSIIDGELYKIGVKLRGSRIDVVKPVMAPVETGEPVEQIVPTAKAQTTGEFFKENWPWFAIGGVALVFVPRLLR